MEQIRGTVDSVTQKQTQKGSTMWSIEVNIGKEFPVRLSTMVEPTMKDGEHTFYYDLGDPYINKYGKEVRTKWLRSIDTPPQGATKKDGELDMTQLDKILLSLTDLHYKLDKLLGKPEAPKNNQEVDLEDIPF